MNERLSYVGKAADDFNGDQFQKGLRALVARVSYIDMLACTIRRVPNELPHENGARLGEAMLNIVEPRVLFPDKPPTPDDSIVTAYYTGLRFDRSLGTSVSIGYLGELYIDFDYFGAVFGTFLIGLLAGRMFAILRGWGGISLLFTYPICAMSMLLFIFFESDLVRFLGSALTAFAALPLCSSAQSPHRCFWRIAKRNVEGPDAA